MESFEQHHFIFGRAKYTRMARINIIGFETGDASECGANAITGTGSVQNAIMHTGGYAFKSDPTTTATGFVNIRRPNPSAALGLSTIYVRFYFYYVTAPASGAEIIFRSTDGTNTKFELRLDSTGILIGYDSVLNPTSGATVLSAATWYRIEVMVETGLSNTYEVKIDGAVEMTVTAVNLLATNHAQVMLGKSVNRANQTVEYYFDDYSMDDSAYPGVGVVEMLQVDGDGTLQDFTGTYTDVDELPPNAADYLTTTGSAGQSETHTLLDSGTISVTSVITAVKCHIVALRNGGVNGSVQALLYQGGSEAVGAAGTTAAGAQGYGVLAVIDPASGVAFTTADIDSLEAGSREASPNASRIAWVGLMVEYDPNAEQIITPPSIDSEEAFGTHAVNLTIIMAGIASAEAFGTDEVITDDQQLLEPTSINTAEAFGSHTIVPDQLIEPSSIGSGYVSGTPTIFIPPTSAIMITVVGEIGQRTTTITCGSREITDVDWTISGDTVIITVTSEDLHSGVVRVTTITLNFPNVVSITYVNLPRPLIDSISPTSGSVGDSVTITGMNFTGIDKVTINGVEMEFTVDSDTQITAEIPDGAVDSRILISHPENGNARSDDRFDVVS